MGSSTQPADAKSVQQTASSLAEMPMPGPVNSSGTNQYSMIGKSIRIKGEITASDPLYVYGSVEGSITAPAHRVTIGKDGTVKADISAREVVVRGHVDGKVDGTERVQLWNTGRVTGEVRTERLAIEDGAILRGKVEAGKPRGRGAENSANSASAKTEKSKSGTADAASRAAVI